MARPNPIVVAIKERIARKTEELEEVRLRVNEMQAALASLMTKEEAILMGIQEDTELLENAKPKQARTKKETSPDESSEKG